MLKERCAGGNGRKAGKTIEYNIARNNGVERNVITSHRKLR